MSLFKLMMFQTDPDPASRQFVGVVLGIGVIVSTLLSIWSISIDSVINNDGVEYYRVAELFSSGDWRSGLEFYRWPFYPWLMMIVGDTIGMSYKTAGHVLNTIFFALIVVFFVSAVRSLGGRSKSITTIAMVIALVHPAFNEYRAFLIRDPGYLAAYLLAVCCLFQYRRSRNARYIFGTAGSFFIAGLFRIEGLVFLFSTPLLFSLMNPRAVRYSHHWLPLVDSMISVLILIAVLGYWVFPSSESFDDFSLVSDPIGFVTAAWHQIAVGVDTKLVVLREFLGPYSESDKTYPINYYGKTKLEAENILRGSRRRWVILRPNVLFGNNLLSKSNFFSWVYNSLINKRRISIVTDQISNPSYINKFVHSIFQCIFGPNEFGGPTPGTACVCGRV